VSYGVFGFSKSFRKYVEDRHPEMSQRLPKDAWRLSPVVIKLAREFGLKAASDQYAKLEIEVIPAFCTWSIDEYDGAESLTTSFPWAVLAVAFLEDNVEHPLRKAFRDGVLIYNKGKVRYGRLVRRRRWSRRSCLVAWRAALWA
jgi:hypothetical protein